MESCSLAPVRGQIPEGSRFIHNTNTVTGFPQCHQDRTLYPIRLPRICDSSFIRPRKSWKGA
jgi:hypothetical protein